MRDDVGALFTDVAMPNMNGVALAKIVSERWPEIGIVVTSGAMPLDLKLELPVGSRFIQKPYAPEKLSQGIEAVLPLARGPVALHSIATMQAGKMHGAGGLAQPLQEPEK